MPRIIIEPDSDIPVRILVVEISDVDGIYALRCTGDGVDQCPEDLEPGDTWSSLIDCIQDGVVHMGNHEKRGIAKVTGYRSPFPEMTDRAGAGPMCISIAPRGSGTPWGCTRPYGHEGDHEAGGLSGQKYASWPQRLKS